MVWFFYWHKTGIRTHLNATVRWTVACSGLDRCNTFIFASGENAIRIPHSFFPYMSHMLQVSPTAPYGAVFLFCCFFSTALICSVFRLTTE